jgi:uncharacterized protein (DUF1800 family)
MEVLDFHGRDFIGFGRAYSRDNDPPACQPFGAWRDLMDMTAQIAANRFGLGARPGELAAYGKDGRGALLAALTQRPATLPGDLAPSDEILRQAIELRQKKRLEDAELGLRLGQIYRPYYLQEAQARFAAAVASEHSFLERLTHFWSNHFAVSIDKLAVLGLAGAYEREAIRPNILGDFSTLLLAVERHPAMLLYLDNHFSIGPHSVAARFAERRDSGRKLGLNENLAREILELHTLGVDGGYSQQDVTTFAAMITGWSIGGDAGRLRGGEPGRFYFREVFHEPGAKRLLGKDYREDGMSQGETALRDLARHPNTARHLATKLARHFIADEPPAAAVDSIAAAWLHSAGDLPSVYRALLDCRDAWDPALRKYKTPADYAHSVYRALELPVDAGRGGLLAFELLGQRTFQPGSPAGWPDRSADWDGSSALLKRIEFAQQLGARLGSRIEAASRAREVLGESLAAATLSSVQRAADGAQGLTLLLSAPEFMRR